MASYTKPVDIWATDPKTLQPGQWVFTGEDGGAGCPARGRYYGVKPSGVVVVAWMGNARSHSSVRAYCKSIHQYARGR